MVRARVEPSIRTPEAYRAAEVQWDGHLATRAINTPAVPMDLVKNTLLKTLTTLRKTLPENVLVNTNLQAAESWL